MQSPDWGCSVRGESDRQRPARMGAISDVCGSMCAERCVFGIRRFDASESLESSWNRIISFNLINSIRKDQICFAIFATGVCLSMSLCVPNQQSSGW